MPVRVNSNSETENTTYAEYLEFANRINEARDKVGKRFLPDKGLAESIQDLEESIDRLNE